MCSEIARESPVLSRQANNPAATIRWIIGPLQSYWNELFQESPSFERAWLLAAEEMRSHNKEIFIDPLKKPCSAELS